MIANLPNLDQFDIPEDARILVFLIAEDLKTQRVFSALSQLGCDDSYLRSSLNRVVLAFAGFEEQPEAIYDFYFRLLEHSEKQMDANYDSILKQALIVYGDLMLEKKRLASAS